MKPTPRRPGNVVVPTTGRLALLLIGACVSASCRPPETAIEEPEPAAVADDTKPASIPTIRLEDGPSYEPGDVVKGWLVGLEEGKYELIWADRAGTLWKREFTGPGERAFSFTASYPRFARNALTLVYPEGSGAPGTHLLSGFDIDLPPPGRKGYLRVLDPGDRDPSELKDFPAEATLWNPSSGVFPLERMGHPILLDIAWELPPPDGGGRPVDWDPGYHSATAAVSFGSWPPPEEAFEPYMRTRTFRAFVRDKYASRVGRDRALACASQAWGRELASWGEVVRPSSPPNVLAGRHSLAQWGDYLEFLEDRTKSVLSRSSNAASLLVRGAPPGFFGLESPSAPGTPPFDVIGERLQWRGGAFRPGMARLASEFLPGGRPLVSRNTPTPATALRAALTGSLVQVFGPEEHEAALACEPLARGLGRLLEVSSRPRASPRDDGMPGVQSGPGGAGRKLPGAQVALIYSHSSVRASFLLDAAESTRRPGPGEPFPKLSDTSWDRVWEGWCAILSDLGVPFVPLTEGEVARGGLVSGRFRAVILARMLSASEDTAHALREFADSGGILIADAGTGMFDGRLVRVRGSEAQRLFGIEHASRANFSEVGARRRMIADGQLRLVKPVGTASWFAPRGPLGVGPAEAGLVLAGARAEGLCRALNRGEVPCLTVNRAGGGWAVMLNLAVSAYLDLRALPGGGKGLRELVAGSLRRARVRPAVELAYEERTYPPPSVTIRDAGAVRLVVLTRDEREGVPAARVRLRFASGGPPVAYDALAGRLLGWTSDVRTELGPGEVRLYALFPYQLTSILAEPLGRPPGSARPGPETFGVTLRKEGEAPFEFHVIRVGILAPDGRERPELSTLVEVSGGRSEFVVPFAESDPPGLWTLSLRDAATGVRAVRRFVRRQRE